MASGDGDVGGYVVDGWRDDAWDAAELGEEGACFWVGCVAADRAGAADYHVFCEFKVLASWMVG